ncbi:MAG: hypothetical protein KY391_02710, partial [Actinobacteria bacterium]|nr:hypothetical protein [Actinomycetota bacterium]
MALKGKKKSRSRGSQARRRPAAAPRPTYGSSGRQRWYQTTTGLVLAFVVIVAAGILVWWIVGENRSEAQRLETAQDQLDTYTSSLDTIIQSISPVATDLATAGELEDAALAKQAKEWKNQLAAAQTAAAQTMPPEGLEPLGGILPQALLLYSQSIEQYELLPELDGKAREEVAAAAAASFQAASSVFASAIEILDAERQDNEMSASGFTAPGAPPEAMAPPGGEL